MELELLKYGFKIFSKEFFDLVILIGGYGILVSTCTGGIAYSVSFNSIVYNTLYTLFIMPISLLKNRIFNTLINSVTVSSNKVIKCLRVNDFYFTKA